MSKYVVAAAKDLLSGSRKLVTVKGRPVAIFNIGGELCGLLNRCPHQGGSLCDGRLIGLLQSREPGDYAYSREGEILRCPWHGWEFDVRTGQSWCEPERVRSRRYAVSVEAGTKLAEGAYVAETLQVTIEGDYVVVEA